MPALDQLLLMIEQNCWQDAALSAGNIFFCFTMIPMLRHPSRPPVARFGVQEISSDRRRFVHSMLVVKTESEMSIRSLTRPLMQSRSTAGVTGYPEPRQSESQLP